MKLLFASDLHGSAYYAEKLEELIRNEAPDKTVLLGDLLYHGPRNDLPQGYAPKEVIAQLSQLKERVFCVRGNCEAEVDQMVLEFPVLAEYCVLVIEGKTFFATHGHVYNTDHLPPLKKGDILIHGHTHVLKAENMGDYIWLNPGSVSIPKEGNPHTYAVLENGLFEIKDFDGNVVKSIQL